MRADEIGESIRSYLGMTLRPVGVKIHTGDVNHLARPKEPMWYCHAIRESAKGRDILMRQGDEACKVAEIVLGFREPKRADIEHRITTRTQAISIGPLQDADQVIFILNPERAMTMAVLLGGINSRITGQMSLCREITAEIANGGEPRFSFLCKGARRHGEYGVEEIVLGMPYEVFLKLPEKMGRYSMLAHKAKAGLRQLFSGAR